MNSTRRGFVLGLSAIAGGFTGSAWPQGHPAKTHTDPARPGEIPRALPPAGPSIASNPFESPLRIPGSDGMFASLDAVKSLRLTARNDRHPLFPGRTTDLLTFRALANGKPAFNPLLRARKGSILDVTLANELGEDTTIHWHGLFVDEKNDGSGMHPVRSGESYVYRFKVLNRAGLYWYHPHPHDRTGAQIHLGMGGMLLVEDDEDDALRRELGLEFGKTEIPLVIQDKQVDDRNRIKYSMGEDDWIGNRMLLNWTPEPYLDAMTCLHRFRILNASNARTYLLAFIVNGRKLPYTLIGTDGGLLDKPRDVTEAYLAPAQRLDVLVDFEKLVAGSTVTLASLRYDPMENDVAPPIDPAIEHPGAPPLGDPIDLMRINVKVPVCAPRRIPATLSSMPALPRTTGRVRKFRLHMKGPRWLINGFNYHDDMRAVRVRVTRGTAETWQITNDMVSMPHPMHLHGFHFRVVERRRSPAQVRRLALTARGLTAQDHGWQDTVLVWPGETVRLVVDFSQPFTGRQLYMFHCHNLEHEDQGMMLNFSVES